MGTEIASAGLADLDTLEIKVERVVGHVNELRGQNTQLDSTIRTLHEQLAVRDDMVDSLRRDLAQANLERRDIRKEELIRSKLATLLSKLEVLEG
ncbi:hypothetical protein BMS3Bbin04_00454 [bacterium BMS3Bbin04]|nr:hypothetical protein BMS3Bbin04_00454 [bacterium BMS3Bbin04]